MTKCRRLSRFPLPRLALMSTLLFLAACAVPPDSAGLSSSKPVPRPDALEAEAAEAPDLVMRWDHRPEGKIWTGATMSALSTYGAALPDFVPADIATYCPNYPTASRRERQAFWTGLLSSLAKHESTWRPNAAGGGGRWIGLVQIAPATARAYGCKARTVGALKNGAANLRCAVRIMARTVLRDGVISAGSRGVAADWGPFHSSRKRQDMQQWTRRQSYCSA